MEVVVKEFRRKLSGAGRETGSFSSSLLISSLASLSDIAITVKERSPILLVYYSPTTVQGVLFGMKQAGINQGFWVMFLGLIPWFSTITH